MGNAIWKQYCAEHGIGLDGKRENKELKENTDVYFKTFFEETVTGQLVRLFVCAVQIISILLSEVPRNLGVDLEPTVLDDVRRGQMKALFHPEFLVNGKEDAANNFARGHYTVGKEQMDIVNDRIRKMVDNSENVQGFIV